MFQILTSRRRRFVSLIEKEWEKAKKQEDKEIEKFAASRRRREWWYKNEKKVLFLWIPTAIILGLGILFVVLYIYGLRHPL